MIYRSIFYLHAKFQEYSDNFKAVSDRIHLISFGEVAVNEMPMRCRMLITDYSSVCWDVLYQDKPTLFYQFDLDKYNEAHGSYIDNENGTVWRPCRNRGAAYGTSEGNRFKRLPSETRV